MEKVGRIDVLVGATKIEGLVGGNDIDDPLKKDLLVKAKEIRNLVSNPAVKDETLQPLGEDLRRGLSGINQQNLNTERAKEISHRIEERVKIIREETNDEASSLFG